MNMANDTSIRTTTKFDLMTECRMISFKLPDKDGPDAFQSTWK